MISYSACAAENQVKEREAEEAAKRDAERLQVAAEAVKLSTAMSVAGYEIVRHIDVVVAESAFVLGIMQGFAVGLTEAFGGESGTTHNALAKARDQVLQRLRREAAKRGANAVIAVDLDYSEFSGIGKPIIFIVASGTAVIIESESLRMALITCPECKKETSDSADRCPHCGFAIKRGFLGKAGGERIVNTTVLVIIVVLVLGLFLGFFSRS